MVKVKLEKIFLDHISSISHIAGCVAIPSVRSVTICTRVRTLHCPLKRFQDTTPISSISSSHENTSNENNQNIAVTMLLSQYS